LLLREFGSRDERGAIRSSALNPNYLNKQGGQIPKTVRWSKPPFAGWDRDLRADFDRSSEFVTAECEDDHKESRGYQHLRSVMFGHREDISVGILESRHVSASRVLQIPSSSCCAQG